MAAARPRRVGATRAIAAYERAATHHVRLRHKVRVALVLARSGGGHNDVAVRREARLEVGYAAVERAQH
eukprot:2549652-Prymnesium_polylepis.1